MNDLIGIPYRKGGRDKDGADCWGLALMVLRRLHGDAVPEETEHYLQGAELAEKIEQRDERWRPVSQLATGTVIILGVRGAEHPSHIGVAVDNRRVIHSTHDSGNGGARVHDFGTIARFFQVFGMYQWQP